MDETTATAGAENATQSTEAQPQATQANAGDGTKTAPATAATESFINADGTLKDGWRESNLIPADFKGRPIYKNIAGNTVADLLKHIGNQDIAISKQGKGIFVPAPDATQTEKDMFFKAIGRPDTPQGYEQAIKAVIPKGMEETFNDPEAMGEFTSAMHKAGATHAVVATAVGIYAKQVARAQEQMKADPMPFFEEVLPLVQPLFKAAMEAELQKRWGDSYQSRKTLFQRAIVENTKEGEERDLLLVNCERDPLFMDLLATIMNKSFTSGMGVDTSTGSSHTAQSVPQRIESIMKNPVYQNANLNPKEHDRLVKEINDLYSSQSGGKMLE
jgi:hypothetical protein